MLADLGGKQRNIVPQGGGSFCSSVSSILFLMVVFIASTESGSTTVIAAREFSQTAGKTRGYDEQIPKGIQASGRVRQPGQRRSLKRGQAWAQVSV